MKKQYEEPATEIIRYPDEDVILTSSQHHCGTGIVTGHDYVDTTGDEECDTDDNFHCGGESGDYGCDGYTCHVVDENGCSEVTCNDYSEGT